MTYKKIHGWNVVFVGFAVASLVGACGPKHHDDDDGGEIPTEVKLEESVNDKELRFRGSVELSTLIESAILTTKGEFFLSSYLGSLTELIGFYSSTPANPGWRNVSANTISTATHFLAFDELALDLAKECESLEGSSSQIHGRLKPEFSTILRKYCLDSHLTMDEYKQVWTFLTGGVVPTSEWQGWREEMQKAEDLPVKERFELLVSSAMTSPWFIFKD